ncbi:hypothetical protein Ddye_029203 [Dipteronia dyeriana]|uniref:R13L1/DRL21-like LRR repeat region domain-containing protein n=1 Tax=Dipteronia dyeriana TaxID=168575 RepID=A0AAD9WKF4_9ROSI|nr:hypothetical protein Ddye_029203 [Dipteronia dyeriana]
MYRLKNLQTLSHFVVGKDSGSGIRDLRDMKQLQGTLLISGLQNVISFIDAVEANSKDKKGLARLVFQRNNSFNDSTNEKDEEEVYKVLRIWNCPSLVLFPVTGLPSTLIGLEIESCEALQFLPVWMTHDPHMKNERNTFSLECLIIEVCPCLISVPREDEMSAIATLKGL